MKQLPFVLFVLLGTVIAVLLISCDGHSDTKCAPHETKISSMFAEIGSYTDNIFTFDQITTHEAAAIRVEIEETDGNPPGGCDVLNPIAQTIETITITSDTSVFTNDIEFFQGDPLNELFTLFLQESEYTIPEFITAHMEDPSIFYEEGNELIFQLINAPDSTIDQTFSFEFGFDDNSELTVITPMLRVTP